ncbi:MAG: hypothetical protein Tsb0021_13690 [Chlamydiales bacterium]
MLIKGLCISASNNYSNFNNNLAPVPASLSGVTKKIFSFFLPQYNLSQCNTKLSFVASKNVNNIQQNEVIVANQQEEIVDPGIQNQNLNNHDIQEKIIDVSNLKNADTLFQNILVLARENAMQGEAPFAVECLAHLYVTQLKSGLLKKAAITEEEMLLQVESYFENVDIGLSKFEKIERCHNAVREALKIVHEFMATSPGLIYGKHKIFDLKLIAKLQPKSIDESCAGLMMEAKTLFNMGQTIKMRSNWDSVLCYADSNDNANKYFGELLETQIKMGFLEDAEQTIQKFCEKSYRYRRNAIGGQYYAELARAYAEKGDKEKAMKLFDQALDLANKITDTLFHSETLQRIAEAQANSMFFKEALETLERAKKYSFPIEASKGIASAYLRVGRFSKALEYCREGVESVDASQWDVGAKALYFKGVAEIQSKAGDKKAAYETIKKGISLIHSEYSFYGSFALSSLLKTLAETGLFAEMKETLEAEKKFLSDFAYNEGLSYLAKAQAKGGLWLQADQTISLIVDKECKLESLVALAKEQALAGLDIAALATMNEAYAELNPEMITSSDFDTNMGISRTKYARSLSLLANTLFEMKKK